MVEVGADSKTYCIAQPIGYTKQPGFDRRNLQGRHFGDPAKPVDEAVFQVQEGQPITLQAETILAIYGEHSHLLHAFREGWQLLPHRTSRPGWGSAG